MHEVGFFILLIRLMLIFDFLRKLYKWLYQRRGRRVISIRFVTMFCKICGALNGDRQRTSVTRTESRYCSVIKVLLWRDAPLANVFWVEGFLDAFLNICGRICLQDNPRAYVYFSFLQVDSISKIRYHPTDTFFLSKASKIRGQLRGDRSYHLAQTTLPFFYSIY